MQVFDKGTLLNQSTALQFWISEVIHSHEICDPTASHSHELERKVNGGDRNFSLPEEKTKHNFTSTLRLR